MSKFWISYINIVLKWFNKKTINTSYLAFYEIKNLKKNKGKITVEIKASCELLNYNTKKK